MLMAEIVEHLEGKIVEMDGVGGMSGVGVDEVLES